MRCGCRCRAFARYFCNPGQEKWAKQQRKIIAGIELFRCFLSLVACPHAVVGRLVVVDKFMGHNAACLCEIGGTKRRLDSLEVSHLPFRYASSPTEGVAVYLPQTTSMFRFEMQCSFIVNRCLCKTGLRRLPALCTIVYFMTRNQCWCVHAAS